MANQNTRPQSRREFMDTLVNPYSPEYGNPNQVFSQPKKAGQPENNRAQEASVKGAIDREFKIGIKDINEAVMYYFEKVLRLSVIQNNTKVAIPIIYGSPENWKGVQADGYYRDKQGRLMAPLLMFKRDSITQNRNLGYKLDGNTAHNVQLFEKKYSKRNYYSNFSVLNNRSPEREFIATVIPDYVTVEYTCIVWTYFVEQMDKVIEALNYASRAFWGDPNLFQFYSSIETFEDTTEYEQGNDRAVRTSFRITLNGYLIPDNLVKNLSSFKRAYGVSKIVFGFETTDKDLNTLGVRQADAGKRLSNVVSSDGETVLETLTVSTTPTASPLASVMAADGLNTTTFVSYTLEGIGDLANTYLNTQVTKIADVVGQDPILLGFATFTGASILQPPANVGLDPTSVDQFVFTINGQYIPSNYITLTEAGGNVTAYFDTNAIGYQLESNDEVVAVGKFA